MIAKGMPHRLGAALARYLVTPKAGERAELWELRGFAATNIVEAFQSVQVMAQGTRCEAPFLHVAVRNREGEKLDRKQWEHVANSIERTLGLEDQPRAIAFHIDAETDEPHMHIAFSRICQEKLTARPLSFFKRRLKSVSRDLERQFGLEPVRNVRQSFIDYAPTCAEDQQARRLGIDPHAIRETIRVCFEVSDCGRSFQAALTSQHLILARGDRRDYIVVDRAGGIYALGKRILGVRASEVRTRLADLLQDDLPTVEEARFSVRAQRRLTPVPSVGPQHEGRACIATPRPKARPSRKSLRDLRIGSQIEPPKPVVVQTVTDKPRLARTNKPEIDTASTSRPLPDAGLLIALKPTSQRQRPFSDILKRQFKALVRTLTRRAPSPQSQSRRRRGDGVLGAIQLAARAIFKPVARLSFICDGTTFLREGLAWLHLWAWTADHDENGFPNNRDGREEALVSPQP